LLLTDLGQHGFGFGAQTGGLVQIALNLGGLGVQAGRDQLGHPGHHHDGDEDQQADGDPQLGIGDVVEMAGQEGGHQTAPLIAAASSASVALEPVRRSSMAPAASAAMVATLVMAASRVLAMALSASAMRAFTTASSAARRAWNSARPRCVAAGAVARASARAFTTSARAASA